MTPRRFFLHLVLIFSWRKDAWLGSGSCRSATWALVLSVFFVAMMSGPACWGRQARFSLLLPILSSGNEACLPGCATGWWSLMEMMITMMMTCNLLEGRYDDVFLPDLPSLAPPSDHCPLHWRFNISYMTTIKELRFEVIVIIITIGIGVLFVLSSKRSS